MPSFQTNASWVTTPDFQPSMISAVVIVR